MSSHCHANISNGRHGQRQILVELQMRVLKGIEGKPGEFKANYFVR
jgi:hypothetical protein